MSSDKEQNTLELEAENNDMLRRVQRDWFGLLRKVLRVVWLLAFLLFHVLYMTGNISSRSIDCPWIGGIPIALLYQGALGLVSLAMVIWDKEQGTLSPEAQNDMSRRFHRHRFGLLRKVLKFVSVPASCLYFVSYLVSGNITSRSTDLPWIGRFAANALFDALYLFATVVGAVYMALTGFALIIGLLAEEGELNEHWAVGGWAFLFHFGVAGFEKQWQLDGLIPKGYLNAVALLMFLPFALPLIPSSERSEVQEDISNISSDQQANAYNEKPVR